MHSSDQKKRQNGILSVAMCKANCPVGIVLGICFAAVLINATASVHHVNEVNTKALQVFCGAAGKPAMEECSNAFEKETGIAVDLQFGGSGAMLSKLKMAGRGDVFVPGSPDYMAKAVNQGIVDATSVKILSYLVPAVLVRKGNPLNIQSLGDLALPNRTVGIGNPEAVCVGLYATEIMDEAGLLDPMAKNIVVQAESCSKTAALIVLEAVDAVIGWRVFSFWNPNATDAVLLNSDQIPRLGYIPAGICLSSENRNHALRYIEFLKSAQGTSIFRKWGYAATEQEARAFAPNAVIGVD